MQDVYGRKALTTTTAAATSSRSQQFTLELCKLGLQLTFTSCQSSPSRSVDRFSEYFVPKWKEVFLFFWVLAISDSMSLIYSMEIDISDRSSLDNPDFKSSTETSH